MGRVVGLLYLFKSGVRIYLRGSQTGMPEQLLNGAYICAVVQHGGGKSMPQDVWRMFF